MNVKIKKHFLKIFISVLAVVSAFVYKGFWNESLNLKNIEGGSRKLFKIAKNNVIIDIANADTTDPDGGDGDTCGCSGSCGGEDADGCSCGGDGGGDGGGCDGATCFIAGHKVTMADKTLKNIEDVLIGDKVVGENGMINTVMAYERPIIGSRKTYIINGMVEFTGDHPFLSNVGWKVADLDLFNAFPRDLPTLPTKLEVGDKLFTQEQNVFVTIETLESRTDRPAEEIVYDLKLDGSHTYTVEGLIVHNC